MEVSKAKTTKTRFVLVVQGNPMTELKDRREGNCMSCPACAPKLKLQRRTDNQYA